MRALKLRLVPKARIPADPRLVVEAAGLRFPNPLGLAAGYDKHAEAIPGLFRLGFGFVEVGTVTPRPQPGNHQPRLFRLPEAGALINRFGFNSEGSADVAERLKKRDGKDGIVGVNIGANKDADDRIADYVSGIHCFEEMAHYITINVSSPNTPQLRALQSHDELRRLLDRVVAARDGAAAIAATRRCPIFLKVAPDLTQSEIGSIAEAAIDHAIDGLIVSNTTVGRPGVERLENGRETGGLSGRPLYPLSTYVLAAFRKAVGPNMVLIGAGGVEDTDTALGKIEAGADLVQLYTGLIYAGPGLPAQIIKGIRRRLDETGRASVRELRDVMVEPILERGRPAS